MIITPPKTTRILWQCRTAFFLVMLCIVFVAFCRISLWIILPTSIVFSIGSVFIFLYIPLWFKNYKIIKNVDGLCIIKGVFLKTTVFVPNLRIAVLKTITTPITSILKLELVVLKVSRGLIIIPELDKRTLKTLKGLSLYE